MCGRVIVDYDEIMGGAKSSEIAAWLSELPQGAQSNWNLAPTQPIPIVFTSDKDQQKHFDLAHWGIIPPWSKDGSARFTFNARVESLIEKPTFAPSVKSQRCAFPVSGFYEWTGKKGSRTPHAIFGPQPILALAGLYRWWKSPDSEWVLTATILTRSSAGVMERLHDRMPVFLSDELTSDWLNPEIVGNLDLVNLAADLAAPISRELTEYEVRPLRGNGRELIQPAS